MPGITAARAHRPPAAWQREQSGPVFPTNQAIFAAIRRGGCPGGAGVRGRGAGAPLHQDGRPLLDDLEQVPAVSDENPTPCALGDELAAAPVRLYHVDDFAQRQAVPRELLALVIVERDLEPTREYQPCGGGHD